MSYQPYIDPDFDSLIERIYSPRVSIDNEACKDCTLVKVDSANRHGVLLDMVQALTDLDLVISKSYVSSDGGWCMDVFHVTDRVGNKLTDKSLMLHIQQAICESRRGQTFRSREVVAGRVFTEQTALEMTGTDRPGLLSEIAAAIFELGCCIMGGAVWTHNMRAAGVFYIEDGEKGGSITEPMRAAVQEQLESVMEAHHCKGEKRSVSITAPSSGRTHTERRLHQLMYDNMDYEPCCGCNVASVGHRSDCTKIHVSIESCKEKGYSVVYVVCKDRPKLLFDTVCVLTDLQNVVFHASVRSKGNLAYQEYFIRQRDGCTLDTESKRQKLSQCLIAAIERRGSHGLRLEISTQNKAGLLSEVTRVLRENGLSITSAEIRTHGEKATGSIYVTDASGEDVNPRTIELVRQEIGQSVVVVNRTPIRTPKPPRPSQTSSISTTSGNEEKDWRRVSLGSLLWSQLERLSSNFSFI